MSVQGIERPTVRSIPAPLETSPGRRGFLRQTRLLRLALISVDFGSLVAAVFLTGIVWLSMDGFLEKSHVANERHLLASLLVIPLLLFFFAAQGLYDLDHVLTGSGEYTRISHGVTYGVLLVLVASYFADRGALVSRSWLLVLWFLSVITVCLGRFAARRVVRLIRQGGVLQTRVAIIGASNSGVAVAEQLLLSHDLGIRLVGFLDEYLPLGQEIVGEVAVIGRPSDLDRTYGSIDIDEYILIPGALPHQRLDEITRLIVSRDGPPIRFAMSSTDLLTNRMFVAERGSIPLVTLQRARITGVDAFLKRSLDLIGVLLLSMATTPFVVVSLARAIASGERELFERRRLIGFGGERFSMLLLSDRVSGQAWLRGAPALWQVLLGRMSLVGTEPVEARSPDDTTEERPGLVHPGLTGPWRVIGWGATPEQRLTRDLAYVRGYTIWEDLRILGITTTRLIRTSQLSGRGLWRWRARHDLEPGLPTRVLSLEPGHFGDV